MAEPIQLSILLTTHSKPEHFEQLLNNCLALRSEKIEIVVINDGSDRKITQFTDTTISKSNNNRVFLFEHDDPVGRGLSLNEAIIQATSHLLWAPLRADRLNESLLIESIRRFKSDPAAFWTLDYSLPENPLDWITAAEEGELPDDSCLLWNRKILKASNLFFNPFLNCLQGAELAMRLAEKNVWHQTDPFFVIADDQSLFAEPGDIMEFLQTAFRLFPRPEVRDQILARLKNHNTPSSGTTSENDVLLQARQFLDQGDAKRSLELVNRFLRKNPDHHEANHIKISSLEKLRRHVEAAELKHDLQKKASASQTQAELFLQEQKDLKVAKKEKKVSISVVIPTTGLGKSLLETCILKLEEAADPETMELIVVDNASIDDTFDYLEQLQKENFMQITVITNKTNRGFGASINQGLEAASAPYVLIMHNDVHISEQTIKPLLNAFDESPDIALAAPMIDSTDYSTQKKNGSSYDNIIKTDFVDSCCFMIKNDLDILFDEEYQLSNYEMEDFCMQIIESGSSPAVVKNSSVDHLRKGTTSLMGLNLAPQCKWINKDRYHKKWNLTDEYVIPGQGSHPDRFEQLGPPDNPLNPDQEWVNTIQEYLTSEVKTEILRNSWSERELITIVSTLLIADERELLRTLEDRLDELELAPALLLLFVQYYFSKNIYSRCKHYINKANGTHPIFDLYRLKIMVADKELEEAGPLLTKMLNEFPASPDLFHLAGDLYRQSGDEVEAKSFYAMANQMDPFRFHTDHAAFEINH